MLKGSGAILSAATRVIADGRPGRRTGRRTDRRQRNGRQRRSQPTFASEQQVDQLVSQTQSAQRERQRELRRSMPANDEMTTQTIDAATANTPGKIIRNAVSGGLVGGIVGYFWGENGTNTGKGVAIGTGLSVVTGVFFRGLARRAAYALRSRVANLD